MDINKLLINQSKRTRISVHLGFWLCMLALRFYLISITFNVYSGFSALAIFYLSLYSILLTAGVYYIVINLVIRKWREGKFAKSVLLTFLILIFYTIVDTSLEKLILVQCSDCMAILSRSQGSYAKLLDTDLPNIVLKRLVSLGSPFTLFLNLAVPLFAKMAVNSYKATLTSLRLSQENLQLEFNLLKAQLNPHFLFNSMNNIYGLVISGERNRAGELIAGLSDILRYLLYESNEERLPLEKEIKLIRDYTSLEKVRLNNVQVTFDFDTDGNNYQIVPLLLMPLVENAFKFCLDKPGAYINVQISVVDKELRLTLDNTFDHDQERAKQGIGLVNLKRRLELYYSGKHTIKFSITSTYFVALTIRL
jgi:sensor histidine kinase YesM